MADLKEASGFVKVQLRIIVEDQKKRWQPAFLNTASLIYSQQQH